MAKGANQKQRLIRVLQILTEKTNEEHPMTREQLTVELERYGISAERKTIYDDINTLIDMGFDIVTKKGKDAGYFCASRDFELAELKLLVDAVQSSKFITKKKSQELIAKIDTLTDIHSASRLKRNVVVENRVKTANEKIFYNVDMIHEAITKEKVITFKYSELTVDYSVKGYYKKTYRRGGDRYIAEPWALVWSDENYYLVAFDRYKQLERHFRVEKMEDIQITDEGFSAKEERGSFNAAEFEKKVFAMFGGREEFVRLRFRNDLIGVAVDRFGTDISLMKEDENHFSIGVKVAVSPQFYGWLGSLGGGVKILSPNSAAEEYTAFLRQALGGQTEE